MQIPNRRVFERVFFVLFTSCPLLWQTNMLSLPLLPLLLLLAQGGGCVVSSVLKASARIGRGGSGRLQDNCGLIRHEQYYGNGVWERGVDLRPFEDVGAGLTEGCDRFGGDGPGAQERCILLLLLLLLANELCNCVWWRCLK